MRYTGTYMPCSWAAQNRRKKECFYDLYCQGKGIDIGAGCDPVVPGVETWDSDHGQGDATYMEGLAPESYDFVYSSHCLEHIDDLNLALENWWKLVKIGGFLIIVVPHRNLYEQKTSLPSVNNSGHLHMFLIDKDELPDTISLVGLLGRTLPNSDMIYTKKCDSLVDVGNGKTEPEFSIEAVIRKITPEDLINYNWHEQK